MGLFFCTPQDAGVVKDARVWVTSNKPPTVKKQLVSLQFGPLWIGPSIQSSVSEKKSDKRHLITTNFMNIWLHHNMNFVTNKDSLDISQFVTRVLSEFTEPNKDEERVILQ